MYESIQRMMLKTDEIYQGIFSEHFLNAMFSLDKTKDDSDIVEMVGFRIILTHLSQDIDANHSEEHKLNIAKLRLNALRTVTTFM